MLNYTLKDIEREVKSAKRTIRKEFKPLTVKFEMDPFITVLDASNLALRVPYITPGGYPAMYNIAL